MHSLPMTITDYCVANTDRTDRKRTPQLLTAATHAIKPVLCVLRAVFPAWLRRSRRSW
jgi:hypothetical protein